MSQSYQNYAKDSSFFAQFTIKDEIFKFYLQDVTLPSVDYGQIDLTKKGIYTQIPGDSKNHGVLPLSFILDENYEVYTDLLEIQEIIRNELKTLHQFQVFIQNNKDITILRFDFEDVFFQNITGPTLSTKSQETELYMDATMSYMDFKWERVNG